MNNMKNKLTKSQYHESLSPAFVAWRKAMHKVCSVEFDMYCRLFTEKRTYGARTKYWLARETMPSMINYITKNPTFTAGGVEYKVSYEDIRDGYFQYSRKCIFCNKA